MKDTIDLKLNYTKDADGVELCGSSDADLAGAVDDRKSTTGYSFHLQKTKAGINWSTKKQPTAAISTSQAQYQAMVAAVPEALFLQ